MEPEPTPVTSQDWKRIEELFLAASSLPPEERSQFLDSACAADSEVKFQVLAMLHSDAGDGEFMHSLIERSASDLVESEPAGNLAGRRVGSYRVLSLVGKGGMGSVWRAVREGGDFEQEVAIKLVQEGLGKELVERFRRERQILAQLNHPNIARILDGGEVDGVPYLVMEFIDGRPLTAFAGEHNLGLQERIALFRHVCAAVQYAHQHLVVHRDLKPANILVTPEGMPKLLDFGIAKILGGALLDGAPAQTLTGFLMLTPDYASPEQVRGEPVSTASDIYSLGAVLYELLTGERPHGLTNYDALELVQKVCEADTVAPSRHGKPNLRGDLDTIVLKAMQKDPARRYVSADQLSEDLRRYLEGLPVLARPDTVRYRVSKYARRNKWGIAAVAAVVVALSVGLVIAQRQARIASERFEMVRGLANKFVFDVHDEIARVDGTTKARKLVVSVGLQYLDKLAQSAGKDRALLEDLTSAYGRIGDVQGRHGSPNLGQIEAATVSYQKAVDTAERLYRMDQGKYAVTLAVAHSNLALNLWNREKDDDAKKNLQRSIVLAQEAEKRDPKSEKVQELLAGGEFTLGTFYYGDVQVPEALHSFEASEKRWEQIVARNPSQPNRLQAVNAALQLSKLQRLVGELESARVLMDRSRQIIEQTLAGAPDDPRILRQASLVYQYLHTLYFEESKPCFDDAVESLRWRQRSSLITARLTAKDPNNADAKDLRSADNIGTGSILSQIGRAREAVPLLEQGLALVRELKKASPGIAYFDSRESANLRWLAHAYSQVGRFEEARKTAAEAVAFSEKGLAGGPDSAPGQLFLVSCYRMQAYVETAARDFKAARASLEKASGLARKFQTSPKHELYFALALSNYYQSFKELAHAQGLAEEERTWLDKIQTLWQSWPEQNSYTRMRQKQPLARYPW